jgi:hypothetical protein
MVIFPSGPSQMSLILLVCFIKVNLKVIFPGGCERNLTLNKIILFN